MKSAEHKEECQSFDCHLADFCVYKNGNLIPNIKPKSKSSILIEN
jgi:hypothetical protein